MDITIHHSIELSGGAIWTFIIILALITTLMLYPMLIPDPVLPPDPPKGKLGFR